MWKQPRLHELEVPKDIRKQLERSVYWNSNGALAGTNRSNIIQYIGTIVFLLVVAMIGMFYFFEFYVRSQLATLFTTILTIVIGIVSFIVFYKWGWKTYKEAWYHFDEDDEIFTVVRNDGANWETLEIPYEEIDWIEYTDGLNGKAIIKSGKFRFETNRSKSKRGSSVTEIWQSLARIDVQMIGWPIELRCQICNRVFGHHIGTAQCPFDNILLIEPGIKGRIDPKEQHVDDIDRI